MYHFNILEGSSALSGNFLIRATDSKKAQYMHLHWRKVSD